MINLNIEPPKRTRPKKRSIKWEYKTEVLYELDTMSNLNGLGDDGWEFVQILDKTDKMIGCHYKVLFKRQID